MMKYSVKYFGRSPIRFGLSGLLKQAEGGLGKRICLRQHGLSCLNKNIILRALCQLFCHIGISDPAFRSSQIFLVDIHAVHGMLQSIIYGAIGSSNE